MAEHHNLAEVEAFPTAILDLGLESHEPALVADSCSDSADNFAAAAGSHSDYTPPPSPQNNHSAPARVLPAEEGNTAVVAGLTAVS